MGYQTLDEVTGLGKTIRLRNKHTGVPFDLGRTVDEVSVCDGEQKYVFQLVQLADGMACEGDATRFVLRLAYYTQRTDGWFCLGSQFAPILTPTELIGLFTAVLEKNWFELGGWSASPHLHPRVCPDQASLGRGFPVCDHTFTVAGGPPFVF